MNLPNLYKKQISLSEWFANINHEDTERFREEDNWKRERMGELASIIPFPFDKPTSFQASEVVNRSQEFLNFLDERGDEYCALRLIPKKEGLQKLRMRGMTIRDVVADWLPKQNIDPDYYQADFVPHPSDNLWSSIFVVSRQGVVGEVTRGGHNQLTQGFHTESEPIRFRYEFATGELQTDPEDDGAARHIQELLDYLLIDDEEKRKIIEEKFSVEFFNNYLSGYFESVESSDYGITFIDWNRVLGSLYQDFWMPVRHTDVSGTLSGVGASPGVARGQVRIIHSDQINSAEFGDGDILVCLMTSPDYVSPMKRAGAVVTQEGGILSHAAIVSREMGVPCIVGVDGLLGELANDDFIEVDADKGIIKKIV